MTCNVFGVHNDRTVPVITRILHVFFSLRMCAKRPCFHLRSKILRLFLLCINGDMLINVIIVVDIRIQNHKCNELENAFPIFKVSRLVL